MTAKRAPREGRFFRIIGVTGFSAMLVMNFIDWVEMAQPSAEFLSRGWFSNWLPGYAFWTIFLVVGFAGRRRVVARESLLQVEEVTGAIAPADPVAYQLVFDRVFKIDVDKCGKEPDSQIIEAIRAVIRSKDDAVLFFERCEDLGNDARHFMHLKVFGQITLPTVRKELINAHPDLSEKTLARAIEFGLVPKES